MDTVICFAILRHHLQEVQVNRQGPVLPNEHVLNRNSSLPFRPLYYNLYSHQMDRDMRVSYDRVLGQILTGDLGKISQQKKTQTVDEIWTF